MTQLPLNITPLVSYRADQFLVHAGVQEAVTACRAALSRASEAVCGAKEKSFQVLWIEGAARTGKTHLALFVSDLAVSLGLYPRLLDASPDFSWNDKLPARGVTNADFYILDNAHTYFSTLPVGASGDFVRFVEELRTQGAMLLMLSAAPIESFSCDAHSRSRLLEGRGPSLRAPREDEIRDLLEIMARQRGIALTDRKLQFLERRLPRDIQQLEEYLDRVQYISYVTGKPVRFPILGDAL